MGSNFGVFECSCVYVNRQSPWLINVLPLSKDNFCKVILFHQSAIPKMELLGKPWHSM
jgi:hypothetical protein